MASDIRRAVRLDQALHGERFIRAKFLFAILLLGALVVLAAVRLLDRHGLQGPGLVLTGVLLVFFVGGAVNYLALLWLARGPVVGVAPVRRDELRSVTWRMVGLTLVPGAAALAAWGQRPSRRPTSHPSAPPGDSSS